MLKSKIVLFSIDKLQIVAWFASIINDGVYAQCSEALLPSQWSNNICSWLLYFVEL